MNKQNRIDLYNVTLTIDTTAQLDMIFESERPLFCSRHRNEPGAASFDEIISECNED